MSTKTKPYFKYKQKAVQSILDLAWKLLTEANVPTKHPNIVKTELEVYYNSSDMRADWLQIKWRGFTLLGINKESGEVSNTSNFAIRNQLTNEEWNSLSKAIKDIFRYGDNKAIAWYFQSPVEEWFGSELEVTFRSGNNWLRYAKAKEN